uniref:Uncharacterized protein n=1 Tax=Ascaris lumbricoides TaxID=6252 RepID=A0A0M3IMX9_ASCLU
MDAVENSKADEETGKGDDCTLGSDMSSLLSAAERWALAASPTPLEETNFEDGAMRLYLDPWKLSMEVAYEICKRNQWDPQTGRQLRASHSEIPIEQDFEQETAPRTTAVDITPLNKAAQGKNEEENAMEQRPAKGGSGGAEVRFNNVTIQAPIKVVSAKGGSEARRKEEKRLSAKGTEITKGQLPLSNRASRLKLEFMARKKAQEEKGQSTLS